MKIQFSTPKTGDKRIKSWFAWLPAMVLTVSYSEKEGDHYDIRWLCKVTVEQEFIENIKDGSYWRNSKFI